VKKTSKINVNFKVCKKVQFDSYTFQFIFLVPLVFKTLILICFLVLDLRVERKSHHIPIVEKESHIDFNLDHEKDRF
jgi:hypothetical protein